MGIAECHQESIYSYVPQNSIIWFSPRLITYLVSGPWLPGQCWARVPSHSVGLNSSQMSVGCYHNFCAIIATAYLSGRSPGHRCRLKGLQLAWCLPFSSGSMQHTFPYQEHQSVGGKTLVRHSLDFSMFSELYRCFQQQSLTISLQRATYSLGYSLDCLGAPVRPFWPTTQLNITQSKYLKIQCFLNKESRKGQSQSNTVPAHSLRRTSPISIQICFCRVCFSPYPFSNAASIRNKSFSCFSLSIQNFPYGNSIITTMRKCGVHNNYL